MTKTPLYCVAISLQNQNCWLHRWLIKRIVNALPSNSKPEIHETTIVVHNAPAEALREAKHICSQTCKYWPVPLCISWESDTGFAGVIGYYRGRLLFDEPPPTHEQTVRRNIR